eukprot:m.620327 g.620327  ORF g.620327 m.620327 type:complete len:530 (-) comp22534_c0_seq7:96-1685(-)
MEEPESIQGGSTDIDSTECSNECAVTASISEDASYVEANASSENDNASITAADDSGNGSPDSIPKEILVLETVKSLTSLSVTDVDSDASFEDTLKTTLARRNGWKPRSELPVKRKIDPKEASVWSILKKNIGKNLSKISMPIALNEPLSALQRLCEELEHCHLLDKAADEKCPSKQLLYVAAFAVSGYAATYFRGGRKPFNPLLGETYDYVCPEKKFRFVAEQVSHHPPMSAGYATSPKWEVSQESGGETKFRATCLRILPQGRIRVKLLPSGSTFEWCKVTTSVEDIFSGNRWVDHYGTMIVTNNSNRDHAVVSFTQNGVFKKESRRNVEAQVFSTAQGMDSPAVYTFKGKWNEMLVCPELNNEVLFKAPTVSQQRVESQYGFSEYTCSLNDIPPEGCKEREYLLPTDVRHRPDQRMWELAQPGANEKKLQLEQLQRDRRAQREAKGERYEPKYFELKQLAAHMVPISPSAARRRVSRGAVVKVDKKTAKARRLTATHVPDASNIWVYKGGFWKRKLEGKFLPADALW